MQRTPKQDQSNGPLQWQSVLMESQKLPEQVLILKGNGQIDT